MSYLMDSIIDWMDENAEDYDERTELFTEAENKFDVSRRTIQRAYKKYADTIVDIPEDIEEEVELTKEPVNEDDDCVLVRNVRLAKEKQKYQDLNRIERKTFREYARAENTIEALDTELKKILEANKFHPLTQIHKTEYEGVGVVQVSDAHFNELVSLMDNKYDFEVGSQRMAEYASKIHKYFKTFDIKNIVVAFTGDLLNSDRRKDEILAQATNRSKALFLAVDILQQFLRDLNTQFNITCTCVTGNESRVGDELGWVDILASDNYDLVIFNMLEWLFKESPGITFYAQDPLECVMNIAGQNILFMHGTSVKGNSDIEKKTEQIMGKYASKGVTLRYVIYGHIHSARIGDYYARSSSLVGPNPYSDKNLQLTSRASQNIYLVHPSGNIDGIKIDLQTPTPTTPYNIDKALEAYNAKSSKKIRGHTTIFKVQI